MKPEILRGIFLSKYLIIDRPQPNIYTLWSMHSECEVRIFRRIAAMEADIQQYMYFVFEVKCP